MWVREAEEASWMVLTTIVPKSVGAFKGKKTRNGKTFLKFGAWCLNQKSLVTGEHTPKDLKKLLYEAVEDNIDHAKLKSAIFF